MDWKRLYAMYCVMSRRLTRARSVFRVPGVATQAKNNADRVVTPLCREKKIRVSGSTHLVYVLQRCWLMVLLLISRQKTSRNQENYISAFV